MVKKRIIAIALALVLIISNSSAFAHSGRTDSNGGHRDNNNVSGLGYYHYHCNGNPPHLHTGGICPYSSSSNYRGSYSVPTSSLSTSVSVKSTSKIQLDKPKIFTSSHKDYIKIYWEDVDYASKYSIYRATSKNGTYTKIATTTSTSYKDKNVTNEKVYYYKVKAFGSGRYTTSYYSNISSNYRFKGSISIDDEYLTLEDGDVYSVSVTAKGSDRELKAVSDSDDIRVYLSEPDENGVYEAKIIAINNTYDEIDGCVNFYFNGRKSNTIQTLFVDVLPKDNSLSLKKIVPGCDYVIIEPGEVTWFSLFTENVSSEDVGGLADKNLITALITETEVEGAAVDIVMMINEEVKPGEESILTWIDFLDMNDESKILYSLPIIIVEEKEDWN